jgi:hypothetical protein
MADVFGIIALGGMLVVGRMILMSWHLSNIGLVVVFLVFAISALFLWHSERWPTSTIGCLKLAAVTMIIGAGFFLIDIFFGSIFHPDLPPLQAATHAGGAFGFYFTLMICPGITVASLAGSVRALALERFSTRSPVK